MKQSKNPLKQLLDKMTEIQKEKTIKKLNELNIPYTLEGTKFFYGESYGPIFLKIQQDVLEEMIGLRLSDEQIKNMFQN